MCLADHLQCYLLQQTPQVPTWSPAYLRAAPKQEPSKAMMAKFMATKVKEMVDTPPSNTGGMGLIPDQGTRFHMLQLKFPWATTK